MFKYHTHNNYKKQFLVTFVVLLMSLLLLIQGVFAQASIEEANSIVEVSDAILKIEYNSTDLDAGIQIFLDADEWESMEVLDPSGEVVFRNVVQGKFADQGGTELFLESAEPELSELPFDKFLERFPEGIYEIRGIGLGGEEYIGEAILTHNVPDGPVLISPLEGGRLQDLNNTVVTWESVDNPNDSLIIAYQVLVVQVDSSSTALPKVSLDIMMPPTAKSMLVPPGFLLPNTEYEWEVLAIEESGNQTLSSSFFKTAPIENQTDNTFIFMPNIDPSTFVTVSNPYLPFPLGTRYIYEVKTEDNTEHIEVFNTGETKEIMGITTVVVRDIVTEEGELIEDTLDFYAQDKEGNVWYFGEEVKNYEGGELKDNAGSWIAGVNGAVPGIIMPANPQVGDTYRQEYYLGEAEDMGQIANLSGAITVPYGSYEDLIIIAEWNPLEPGVIEHKYFAKGIGLVAAEKVEGGSEREELVEILQD